MARTPTYLDESRGTYLFNKRLNPKKGSFPCFVEKVRIKIGTTASMKRGEALTEAQRLSDLVEHLQAVALRDAKGLPNSQKDLKKAVETWLWLVDVDLEQLKHLRGKHTLEAKEAEEKVQYLVSEVVDATSNVLYRPNHPEDHLYYLTPLGDLLVDTLKHGARSAAFSEALGLYLKMTSRDHLTAEDSKFVRLTLKTIDRFIELVGDKELDSITRRDVERYIEARLQQVKTTSVDREITTLRAVWNKASKALDIRSQNPFSEHGITGLGTDSTRRATASVDDTRRLLQALNPQDAKSYVDPLIGIIALTGMRLSEAWGLDQQDWDREHQVLNIQINQRRSSLKTKHSTRPFPVLPELAAWLEAYLDHKSASSSNSASAATLKRIKSLGFTGLTNHGFRHGMKQRLVEADAPGHIIDELLGWSEQSMRVNYGYLTVTEQKRRYVQKVYSRILPEERDEASNVIQLRR